jgi:hypothetical protein
MRLHLSLLLALGLTLLAAQGCGHLGTKPAAPAEDKITLRLTLNQAAYRPGEVVLASVELTNTSGQPLPAQALSAGSVVFVFGRQGDPERLERQAVYSEREKLDESVTLEPGRMLGRQFVLTRLSEFSGPLVVQAQYRPGAAAGAKAPPRIFSNPVAYQVGGTRLLKRDPAGLIVKDEALKLARTAGKNEAEDAQAIFVRDEAGFYRWYVNVHPKGSAPGTWVGYFVNPYVGGVPRNQARPFDSALARDPRFDRPPNLPAMPMPALVTEGGK